VLSPRSLADVAEDVRRVGAALGRVGAGRVAARLFERRIEAVRALPARDPRPRVAVIEWFDPPWVSGEWIAEMVVVAGGEPVLAGPKDPSRRASWEELAAADPDAIVLAACSMSVERAMRELAALEAHEGWRALRAVREASVFLMDGEAHFSTPGPRLAEGVELLARLLRDRDALPDEAHRCVRVRPEPSSK
jgi:iron complex transport system substrate-binding protein